MLRNWTLRSRLIALVVALLAVTSILVGGVAFLVLRGALAEQFDTGLQSDAQNFLRMGGGAAPGGTNGPASVGMVLGSVNEGQFVAFRVTSVTSTGAQGPALSTGDTSAVESVGTRPVTIDFDGLGSYRLVAVQRFGGGIVVGEPLSQLNREITANLARIAVVVVGAIAFAVLLGAFIIGRALRPLRRVANVASNVAALPLERGDVDLPQRVPERDTNPHTEVGQVGAALNNLLDSVGSALAVRQASEAKVRAFVADASHELRTPLASIRGYAELTRRFGGELTDDVQHNIDRIESETKRMTALVEDLLLLARLDSQPELAAEDVDLSRLLVDVVSDAHAAGRDHRWDLELPDEPVIVRGDDARLHQVFTNLLANARVHTPPDTRVTVQLREPAGDDVTVLVRDSGPGIAPDLLPRLFGRFVRGDSSRNRTTGSTGLGLSIVSAVVQAQGGTVEVVSEPGDTTFRVTLPSAGAGAGATTSPSAVDAPATGADVESAAHEPSPASA